MMANLGMIVSLLTARLRFLSQSVMTPKTTILLLVFASSVLVRSASMAKILAFRVAIALVVVYKYYYFVLRIRTIRGEEGREVCDAQQEGV